jgi:hypothetical protein
MATTKMIAGLMGPTLLAIGIAMLVNARHFPEMAKQIGNDPGLIFVSGILLLVAGLAIARVHAKRRRNVEITNSKPAP